MEERPRERLSYHGPKSLSNAELIAILLGSGSTRENVIQLSHNLLKTYPIESLSRRSVNTLGKIHGIGPAKACQLVAAFELGRRVQAIPREKKFVAESAKQVFKKYQSLALESQEQIVVLYLDGKKQIINEKMVFLGSASESVVHAREIYSHAITEGAVAVVIVHNHPSGDPSPSNADMKITEELVLAGEILGIELLDHVIIGKKKYYSFKEHNYIR